MLLEIGVGDAYGAGFEYADDRIIRNFNNLTKYIRHQKHGIIAVYTDDAQRAIANAELILEDTPWSKERIADQLVGVFKRDERNGYASGFYYLLKEVHDGKELLKRVIPNSDKSGGAMGASPIGYFPTIQEVIEHAKMQAEITHNTPIGINSAIAAALMSHFFIYKLGRKEDLGKFVENYLGEDWSRWRGKVGSKGNMSVSAAMTAIIQEDSLASILKKCVDFGGDTDTVAAIAMGAASCSQEVKQDLPECLINGLENGAFGRDYLIELDRRLKNKFEIAL